MCDHDDVTQLEINMIQASDGFTRYKCKSCKDVEFNRFYMKYYNLCIDHESDDLEIPTYKDSEGKICCNWCGVKVY